MFLTEGLGAVYFRDQTFSIHCQGASQPYILRALDYGTMGRGRSMTSADTGTTPKVTITNTRGAQHRALRLSYNRP